MKLFVKILCLFLFTTAAFFLLLAKPASSATLLDPVCQTPEAKKTPTCLDAAKQNKSGENPVAGPNGVVQTAANVIAMVAGIAAVVTIIVSGIMYATAGGVASGQRAGDNPTRAKNARLVLTNALIGLIIIALTWTLASFIIQKVISF